MPAPSPYQAIVVVPAGTQRTVYWMSSFGLTGTAYVRIAGPIGVSVRFDRFSSGPPWHEGGTMTDTRGFNFSPFDNYMEVKITAPTHTSVTVGSWTVLFSF